MSFAAVAIASESESERRSVFLQPGQLHTAATPTTITTILASCVAVCLFDPRRGIGGMNHFLLPHALSNEIAPARFGVSATRLLINRLLNMGSSIADLKAKVFGGAAVIEVLANRERMSPGESNARCAFDLLMEAGIPIVASNVGGTRGRKIIFHTENGAALMKFL